MNEANKILDIYNVIVGGVVTILTVIFGKYWILSVGFLMFNVFDYITGYMKARKLKKESSSVGLNGIVKKLAYWIVIAVSFLVARMLQLMGEELIHIDLSFLDLLGWFTLACLIINEARSILENLVEYGVQNIPRVLIDGLAVTEKILNERTDDILDTEKGENDDDDRN